MNMLILRALKDLLSYWVYIQNVIDTDINSGGEIASTFDHPELVKLGTCKLIEEIMIGEDKVNTN